MPGLYLPWLVRLCNKLQQHLAAKNNKLIVLPGVIFGWNSGSTVSCGDSELGSDLAAGSRVTRRLIHSFVCYLSWDDWKTRILSWTTYMWSPYIV